MSMPQPGYDDFSDTNAETTRSPIQAGGPPQVEAEYFMGNALTVASTFKIGLVSTQTVAASPGGAVSPQEVLKSDLVKALFEWLASNWKNETAHLSSIRLLKDNYHYRQIVELGDDVIPMILEDLEQGDYPAYWYPALKEIAGGEDPVSPEHRGNVREMTRAWVRWAREKHIA